MQAFSLLSTGINSYKKYIGHLDFLSDSIPPLLLRLILAWEFGKAGIEKLHGTNWFADINFPFPFNLLSPEISWSIATYFEIFGAIALVLGLATRFFSISLVILTIVAIASVHWPEYYTSLDNLITGFRVVDETGDGFGNYELPLLFIVMLLPLFFGGAGKLSLDYLIKAKSTNKGYLLS
ncbi:MAG: DoxX family protein [Pseudomonadota bacterium]